ncbi:MAG: hypothetical protein ACTTKD_09730 [Peptoanaerobacter stomatis]|uniref:hypothetical protein n=1 Tax=Peptoanaerobacter stomatis TaxID=796937 RepID=UPI003FA150E8
MTQYMLKILIQLHKDKLMTAILSIDRKSLCEKIGEKVSGDKLGRSLLFLVDEGYIAEGIKNGRIKKYYITEKGLDFLEESYAITREKNSAGRNSYDA